ncbi:FMN-binding negative transcriptional regulator [Roseateles saccharophilus]|uniref:PaiB family negative transcriptional regulator n=1 Tax=Roseateles saccharophilus TaxID=304 RepID=A0A4R3U6R4_ROSSA|nr:PaiB family negative transcriptional regulator [Roseateles saccharophilus]
MMLPCFSTVLRSPAVYLPAHFTSTDYEHALRLMAEHPLALLVGPDAQGQSFGSHLPLVASAQGGGLLLEGHMARANPHWGWLSQQRQVLAVFSGPGAYVSPSHYESVKNVPTWNYAALHAYGDVELIDGAADKDGLLKRLIGRFEPDYAEQWRGLPEDFQHKLLGAIVGFRIRVTRWELKLKMSQNRAAVERQRIRAALLASERAEDRATAEWMARLEG